MKTLRKLIVGMGALLLLGQPMLQASAPGCGNGSGGGPTTPPTCPSCSGGTPPKSCPGGGANPFHTQTGNGFREVTDLTVWGGVGEHQLAFKRYGMSRYNGSLKWFGQGHTWRYSYQWELVSNGTNSLSFFEPDGTQWTYTYSGGQWKGIASNPDRLTQSGSDFTLQRADGFRYRFHTFTGANNAVYYLLLDFTDSTGQVYTLTYDTANRLVQITEPAGRYLRLTYADLPVNQSQFTNLGTITSSPVQGQWTEMTVTNPTAFRYLRYFSSQPGETETFCDIAEMEFYDTAGNKLAGTAFGSSPAYASGREYSKTSDGNVNTFFDYKWPHFGFTGIDLGAGNQTAIGKIRFYPRTGYSARMVAPAGEGYPAGCRFEGSNAAPLTQTVISRVDCSDGRFVTYNYTTMPDTVLPQDWLLLQSAQYGDGTAATYSYAMYWAGQPPLLVEANDPRYNDNATHMKYSYWPSSYIYGQVYQETNGVTNQLVDTFQGGTGGNQVVYANGKVDTITSSTVGVTANTDSLGRKWSFTYSSSGFLSSATDPLNRVTSYTRTAAGNLLSTTLPDGAIDSWTRDSLDLPLSHTLNGPSLTTRTIIWTRDAAHRVTRADYPDLTYETFTYNSFGKVTSHRLRNGGVESMAYDGRGLCTSQTDPLGNVTAFTYDASDRLASMTDANLHTTAYQYSERGLLTQVTNPDLSTRLYTYDIYGNRLSVTDELNHTTASSYDEFKRVTSMTDPLNRTTFYDYTLPGQSCGCNHADNHPTMITLPSSKTIGISYDTEWQVQTRTTGYGTADSATTSYAYDAAGNLTSVTDPRGKIWSQVYDNRNRRIRSTDPLAQTTQWTYDAASNKLTETRADGGVTTNVYDLMNRLTSSTDPKSEATSYAYDGADNLITLTDARSNAYHFAYDLLKRKTQFIYPDSSYESYAFDGVGNQTVYRNRAGVTCTRVFDNRDRETSSTWSDSTPAVSKTYDAAGRLLTAGNGISASTYGYDNANELTGEAQTPTTLGTAFTVGYSYDADGNRAGLTYPDGSVVSYAYTNRNQVSSISAGAPPPLATYAYDANGNRSTKSLENGTSATYSYDQASRLLGISHALTVNTQPSTLSLAYTYNAVNDRLTRSESTGTAPAVIQSYGYDAIDQVTGVDYGTGRTEAFAYDPTGNRISATDSTAGTTSYTANALNQYTAVGSDTPVYDPNGNLTGASGWTYTYDGENRLTSASNGTTSGSFAYDWRRRQVSRTINGSTTWFIYDGWNLLAEYSSTGTLQAKYINGPRVDEILARTDGTGTVYYQHDALGSTVALTDATGAVVERYTYDVFGTPTIHDASGIVLAQSVRGNRFLFTGREWIAQLGLYDYRNRVYSPQLGRFLQTDPIRFKGKDVNLYRYVKNDPEIYLDTYGLCCEAEKKTMDEAQKQENNANQQVADAQTKVDQATSELTSATETVASTGIAAAAACSYAAIAVYDPKGYALCVAAGGSYKAALDNREAKSTALDAANSAKTTADIGLMQAQTSTRMATQAYTTCLSKNAPAS